MSLATNDLRLDDPAFYAQDPYPAYAQLRSNAPVFRYEPLNLWVLSRYEDVRHVSRTPEVFSSVRGLVINDIKYDQSMVKMLFPPEAENLMASDPPRHRQLRKIIVTAFTAKMVNKMEPAIRRIANRVLDRIVPGQPLEWVEQIAVPYPLLVLSELMGLPGDNLADLRGWADDTTAVGLPLSAAEFDELVRDLLRSAAYFGEQFTRKRSCPASDLLTGLLDAQIDGERLNEVTRLMFCQFLLAAGGETTRNLLAGTLLTLLEHPDQHARLAGDPTAVSATAADELLRWITPALGFVRTATRDTEIRGQRIAEGEQVYMLYAAANRDERAWPDADRLDLTRKPDPMHLSFGFGEHICMGASLARMEIRIFLEELMRRHPYFALAGQPRRQPTTLFNAWESVPVVFTANATTTSRDNHEH
jgi:cytochrome P450